MKTLFTAALLLAFVTVPGLVTDDLDTTPSATARPLCPAGTSGDWPACVPNVPNCHYDGDLTFYCHF